MELQVIYDGSLTIDEIAISNNFNYGKFLIFDTPNLPDNEGVEIGFVLAVRLPVIGRTVTKDVLLPLEISQGIVSSFGIAYIPTEYSEAGYSMYCAFNSSISVNNFRVYAVTSACTLEKVCTVTDELLVRVKQLQRSASVEQIIDAAIVVNQLSQNAAILALSSGISAAFAPYTLGASLAIAPAVGSTLTPGTTALAPLLLAGG